MNSLHIEACEPHMKIARFMYAVKHNFANTTMNLTKDSKTSTKQLQGSKKSKIMAQDTSNSDTDSAYNTESECNYTKHLPRPPCSSKATRQHSWPCPNKNQQLINTKCIQKTKPSCILILTTCNISKTQHNKSKPTTQKVRPTPKPSYIPVLNNKRHTVTPHVTQPEIQPTISSLPRPSEETIIEQPRQIHPELTPITKSPLLPTPPIPARQFYNRNHCNQHLSGPSPSRYNTHPTFSGPANHIYYLQPLLPRPSCQHQNFFTRPYQQHQQAQEHFFTRPYQQPQGHCTQQVFHVHISLPYPPQYCAAWRQKTTDYKDISL